MVESVRLNGFTRCLRGASANVGGEGEIRTHETREGPPVFKTRESHICGTHSHANAMFPECSSKTQPQRFTAFGAQCKPNANRPNRGCASRVAPKKRGGIWSVPTVLQSATVK